MTPEWDIAPPSLHAALPKCNIHYRISNLWDREGRGEEVPHAAAKAEGRQKANLILLDPPSLSLPLSVCARHADVRVNIFSLKSLVLPPV